MDYQIRRIRSHEATAYRDIRLRALAGAPAAFGTTLAEALERPPEWWEERTTSYATGEVNALFVAEASTGFCAIAGGIYFAPHEVDVFSMWVDPDRRGSGVADQLLRAVQEWSYARGAPTLHLWVTEGNTPAIRLYGRHGFAFTGEEQPHPSQPGMRELRMRRAAR